MTQANVQYVLQTTEWRYCSRWVNISPKKKPRVGRTEFLWHDRSLYPGRTEGIHLPVQFPPEVGPPADYGRHGWPSTRHQHPVPLRCGWNSDGTQTGKVVSDFPFNYPECCVASRHWWKHPAPRWKCWQEDCQKSNLSLRSKSHCSVMLATVTIYFHS